MTYISHLGRQPDIALAELESLLGAEAVHPISDEACLIDSKPDFKRIGSSSKLSKHITTLSDTKTFESAVKQASQYLIDYGIQVEGKLKLGLSVYGFEQKAHSVAKAALELKKQLRKHNISVRVIPNKQAILNAAQILNNKLTSANGFELNLIHDKKNGVTYLSRTISVQDIDEYARRDRDKPVRDPLVGMLPPKLAQTLINLAQAQQGDTLLDPFCGTGTVLMEASVMGISSIGTDISPAMVRASEENMAWLTHNASHPPYLIDKGDATDYSWPTSVSAIAAETYLGPALKEIPEPAQLDAIINKVNATHVAFLQIVVAQIPSGTRLCLAVPAWKSKKDGFRDLHLLDDLEKLGYNALRFRNVSNQLVYHRDNQLVARRILTLIRK